MSKKAYFFIMDAAVAAIILIIGYMLISSLSISKPQQIYNKHLSEDLMGLLSNTKVTDMCTTSCTDNVLNQLYSTNQIKNKNSTLLELIGELKNRGLDSDINDLLESLITSNELFYKEAYGFALLIDNVPYYYYNPLDPSTNTALNVDNLKLRIKYHKIINLFSSKKIVIGYWENQVTGDITFWGPYIIEMWVWQKP